MKFIVTSLSVIAIFICLGCDSSKPIVSHIQNTEIEYCKSYDEAWVRVREILLAHKYELIGVHKNDGFIRTNWRYKSYSSLGIYIRARFNANFLPYRPVVRVTPDIEFLSGEPTLLKNIPIVDDVLTELELILRCIGDERQVISGGTPPARK